MSTEPCSTLGFDFLKPQISEKQSNLDPHYQYVERSWTVKQPGIIQLNKPDMTDMLEIANPFYCNNSLNEFELECKKCNKEYKFLVYKYWPMGDDRRTSVQS